MLSIFCYSQPRQWEVCDHVSTADRRPGTNRYRQLNLCSALKTFTFLVMFVCNNLLCITWHLVSPNGSLAFSPVRIFMKKKMDVILMVKSITTQNETINLTEEHLIYTRKNSSDKFKVL